MPPRVAHRDISQAAVAAFARGPRQQRDGLHHVDFSFVAPTLDTSSKAPPSGSTPARGLYILASARAA